MSQLESEDLIEYSDEYSASGVVDPPSSSAVGNSVKITGTVPEPSVARAPSSSKGKNAAVVLTKDRDYFMESAFLVFEVEECLFRVPSYLFSKESHIFGGMFHLPQPHADDDGNSEGSSEYNPIKLLGEKKEDFRCVLKALYPLSFTLRLELSRLEWVSILKFSTKYYFLTLRQTAINELNRTDVHLALTSLEKINYGRKYYVSSWLISGLVDLVMREQSINDDEGLDLDSDYPTTAYKLFRTREHRLLGFVGSRASGTQEIKALFKAELKHVRADEKEFDSKVEEDIVFEKPVILDEKGTEVAASEIKKVDPSGLFEDQSEVSPWGFFSSTTATFSGGDALLAPAASLEKPKKKKR